MITMGITGGLDRVDEIVFTKTGVHDSSVVLSVDGEIVAAVEEERFNRYKHSGKLPVESIRYCLLAASLELTEVDKFVFTVLEEHADQILEKAYRENSVLGYRRARPFIHSLFRREFGIKINPEKFEFIDHHYAHAASAFYPSGFSEALVVTIDGMGAGLSGSVWTGEGDELRWVRNYSGALSGTTQSLGHLYSAVTVFLGFGLFDEYKVMGLAPYGDASRHRALFKEVYLLKENGDYDIYLDRLERLKQVCPPRGKREEMLALHQDVAAALQETLETIEFHILEYYRRETGLRRLCLAGGVAHNCAMNGKILRKGLFDEVFVQPAAHDGGLSLGAALHGQNANRKSMKQRRRGMQHALFGPTCGENDEIEDELVRWSSSIHYRRLKQPAEEVAALLAEGSIIGWVQGRSEFGPRALGNRSIIADPRPAENKEIINAMIKKREAFRPFAPSVLEEYAHEFFELPPQQSHFPFMAFVLKVREKYRTLLAAVTHVDGTARIQTVSRKTNAKYWEVIDAFRSRTGIPILLNTSFNNNAEPIVNSAQDALVCFLTTDLNALVIGDYIVTKKPLDGAQYLDFALSLSDFARLHQLDKRGPHVRVLGNERRDPFFLELFYRLSEEDPDSDYYLGNTHDGRKTAISKEMAALLGRADGYLSLRTLSESFVTTTRQALLSEALTLWAKRLVRLLPIQRSVRAEIPGRKEAERLQLS